MENEGSGIYGLKASKSNSGEDLNFRNKLAPVWQQNIEMLWALYIYLE